MQDVSRAGQARDTAAGAGAGLDIRALDVTDHQSARSVLEQISADYGRIDVLINSAGRGSVATAEQLTLQDVQDQ